MTPKPTAPQFDIGAVLSAPAKDPEWLKKCLVMGLLTLVPIIGGLNLSGWTKVIADKRLAGGDDLLPDANLGYIGHGWRMFVAWLPVLGVMFLSMMLMGGGVAAVIMLENKDGEAIMISAIMLFFFGILAFSIIISVVAPAISFLHVVDGERFASGLVRRQWGLMRDGGVQYLLFFVAIFVAGLVAQLGVMAFFVGIFVSAPYAQAMQGYAIAEYNRVLRTKPATFPIDGGVGGSSGSPFGVKL